jgi:hypothetical protein
MHAYEQSINIVALDKHRAICETIKCVLDGDADLINIDTFENISQVTAIRNIPNIIIVPPD